MNISGIKYNTIAFKQSQNSNNNNVNVSIIVPVARAKETQFNNSYNSLLNQSLKNMQFIFLNAKSALTELLKSLPKQIKDNKGNVIISQTVIDIPEDKGPGYARNIGLQNAEGKYVGFLDTDDITEPKMFETLYNTAEITNADVAVCCFEHFEDKTDKTDKEDKAGDEIFKLCNIEHTLKNMTMQDNAREAEEMFIHSDGIMEKSDMPDNIFEFAPVIWNKIFKKDFLNENNIKFPQAFFLEDAPFTLKALQTAKKVSFVDKLLHHYRYSCDSLSDHNSDKKNVVLTQLSEKAEKTEKNKTNMLFDEVYPMLTGISESCTNDKLKEQMDNYISFSFAQAYKKSKIPQYYLKQANEKMQENHYYKFCELLKNN